MKPNILNRAWKYIPAAQTDIRKTFAKEFKAIAARQQTEAQFKQVLAKRSIG